MRVRTAVIGMLTLASLAGCGGYGGTGMYGGGGGGYGGGGGGGGGGWGWVRGGRGRRGRWPAGLGHRRPRYPVRERSQRDHECGGRYHRDRRHRHLDLDRISAAQRPVRRLDELREQQHHDRERDVCGQVRCSPHATVRPSRP